MRLPAYRQAGLERLRLLLRNIFFKHDIIYFVMTSEKSSFTGQARKKAFSDPSLWLLLLANGATIFFAINGSWGLQDVFMVYWAQSVIVGLFYVFRILILSERSIGSRIFYALFLFFCYGFMHGIYLLFISPQIFFPNGKGFFDPVDWGIVFPAIVIFAVNHIISYLYNMHLETKKQEPTNLVFLPFLRILPMHMAFILGSLLGGTIIIFMVIKTITDSMLHSLEHRILRGGRDK